MTEMLWALMPLMVLLVILFPIAVLIAGVAIGFPIAAGSAIIRRILHAAIRRLS